MSWQPIETVPRDGRAVLVFLAEERFHSRIHSAYFHPNVTIVSGYFHFDMPAATHWMPLPEPPK